MRSPGRYPTWATPTKGSRRCAGDLDTVASALAAYGYEPRREGDRVVLANCPFDRLAAEHRALVCTTNLTLVEGG